MGGLRVLHALTGAAGQPRALATALDALDGISARSVITSISSMGYEADAYFPLPRNVIEEQQSLIRAVIDDFDVFHFHYRSVFHDPERVAFPVGLDLLMLKAAGKTVVVHFRGSEVRLQSAFAQKSPYHYVHEGEASIAAFPEPQKKMFIDLVSGIADRVYVTDPEIAEYVPGSVIMERAIDLDRWRFVGVDDTDRPLVVHAPSRQGVKGTASVLAAVERLKARGIAFDFELVEGKSNEEAKLRCQAADIVIDQLRIGWYGVLTVEAMALGKPVIVYIRDDLLHHLGPELPVAVANPETVEQVLESLILSYDERQRLSARARAYCERVHGSAVLAERLAEDYRWMRAHPRPVVPGVVLDHMLRQYQIIEAERRAAAAAVGAAEAARAAAEIKAAALAAAAAEDAVAEKARRGEQAAAAVATTAKVPSAAQPIVLTPRQRARRFVKLVRTKGVGAGAKVVARKLGIRPATS
jgi:glycosyltransferase involved in cell wall biosynthesis